jgi:hypothetical protein
MIPEKEVIRNILIVLMASLEVEKIETWIAMISAKFIFWASESLLTIRLLEERVRVNNFTHLGMKFKLILRLVSCQISIFCPSHSRSSSITFYPDRILRPPSRTRILGN